MPGLANLYLQIMIITVRRGRNKRYPAIQWLTKKGRENQSV